MAAVATTGCRTPCRSCHALRAGLDLDLVPLELEDVEVAARDVDCDVVDRHRPDRAFEASRMRMTVEDDVRPVLGDRRSQPVAAEEGPDALGLAVQRVRGRRVVEEHDTDRAVRDLLQAAPDRLDLVRGLRIDLPQERLTEVRELRPREPAHESLGTDDPDLLSVQLEDDHVAIENMHSSLGQERRNRLTVAQVEIMVAQNRVHGNAEGARRIRQHPRLVELAVGGQVAREQDEIDVPFERREGLLKATARHLGSVHVAGSRDPDHGPHVPHIGFAGNRSGVSNQHEPDFDRLLDAMKRAGGVLFEAGIPFVLGGGLAAWARGGPKTEHDVDFLVKPEDAERAQQALSAAGMRTERPPEGWLLKAYDDGVLIDLIFDPQDGPIDDAFFGRAEDLEVQAMRMKVAALEDVLVQKLLALSEQEPDYSSVLELARSLREQVDWNDVRDRTSRSPFAKGYFTLLDELEIVPA
jgi:predicted nucleotidyltransferase